MTEDESAPVGPFLDPMAELRRLQLGHPRESPPYTLANFHPMLARLLADERAIEIRRDAGGVTITLTKETGQHVEPDGINRRKTIHTTAVTAPTLDEALLLIVRAM